MEGDIMELKHQCFKDYLNPYFIETGSYCGDGIQAALDSGFEHIISIEVNEYNYNECVKRFKDNPKVKLIHGDSALILGDVIKDIHEPITFWLDAHYSSLESEIGLVKNPLLYELNHIYRHSDTDFFAFDFPTIIIDDVRLLKGINSDRDFELINVIQIIRNIDFSYNIEFIDGTEEDDILIATI
jgi:hypothetical protein